MTIQNEQKLSKQKFSLKKQLLILLISVFVFVICLPLIVYKFRINVADYKQPEAYWQAPDINSIKDTGIKMQVLYGRSLIAHTAKYLGPKGTVRRISNGMNCQNCHLDAGTAPFGNNFGSVAATYPKFRARSGGSESIFKRVNDCFERSLNGQPLDTASKEMKAIVAYIQFIGSNVQKGNKAKGAGLKELAFLDRAANVLQGKLVYETNCASCHQQNGQGLLKNDESEYIYPALWGSNSFNDAAGLYRISNFAKYVKYNMPQGVTHHQPKLTNEEAWDVAAYILSKPRPHKLVLSDWPNIAQKPIDHPFGPFADSFSSIQHKYGPFKPMINN